MKRILFVIVAILMFESCKKDGCDTWNVIEYSVSTNCYQSRNEVATTKVRCDNTGGGNIKVGDSEQIAGYACGGRYRKYISKQ